MSLRKITDIAAEIPQFANSGGEEKAIPKASGSRVRALTKVDTNAAFDKHIKRLQERTLRSAEKQDKAIEAICLQETLPLWDDDHRGVPNPFIRSGLFSVKSTAKREYIEEGRIEALSNYEITYSGQDLQQDDLTVWMSLINMVRDRPLSDRVIFTGYQLIKDCGWRMHSETYEKVKKSIHRLKVNGLTIATKGKGNKGYSGSLIRDYAWDHVDEDGNIRWMVRFEPKVTLLFMDDTTTYLTWEQRKAIGSKNPVAQWLHGFYHSHTEPLPYSVSKLHELANSGSPLSTFRRSVMMALAKLVKIGFLETYEIRNDVVSVKRAKAKPQVLFEAKKSAPRKIAKNNAA